MRTHTLRKTLAHRCNDGFSGGGDGDGEITKENTRDSMWQLNAHTPAVIPQRIRGAHDQESDRARPLLSEPRSVVAEELPAYPCCVDAHTQTLKDEWGSYDVENILPNRGGDIRVDVTRRTTVEAPKHAPHHPDKGPHSKQDDAEERRPRVNHAYKWLLAVVRNVQHGGLFISYTTVVSEIERAAAGGRETPPHDGQDGRV